MLWSYLELSRKLHLWTLVFLQTLNVTKYIFFSLSREKADLLKFEIWHLKVTNGKELRLDGLVLNVGLSTFKLWLTAKLIDSFICLFIQMLWFSENTWLTDWIIWDVVGQENFIQSASAFFSIRSFFSQTLSQGRFPDGLLKCVAGTCEVLQSACRVICLPHLWNPIT